METLTVQTNGSMQQVGGNVHTQNNRINSSNDAGIDRNSNLNATESNLSINKVKDNNTNDIQKVESKESEDELKAQLQDIVEKLNEEMEPMKTDIRFGFEEKTDTFYVSVVDSKTDKEIRRFPTDEALRLMEKMREVVGQIFDTKG